MNDMPNDPRLGTRIAGYRLVSFIGRGGMAVVYLAEDERLGRNVALKLLPHEFVDDEDASRRFVREARMAAVLDHPNIIPIYDAGESDDILYIAMRRVEGPDLRALIRTNGRLALSRAVAIAAQVGAALDVAHQARLVHRDVKPANILLDIGAGSDGQDHVYLTDFGLTRMQDASRGPTRSGVFVGTAEYASPEQIQGLPTDGRADQYSLACVLFECLTGTSPFRRSTEVATLMAQLDEPPSTLGSRPELPASLDDVFKRAFAKNPEQRYPRCLDFVGAVRRSLGLTSSEPAAAELAGSIPSDLDAPQGIASGSSADEPAELTVEVKAPAIRSSRWKALVGSFLVLSLAGSAFVVGALTDDRKPNRSTAAIRSIVSGDGRACALIRDGTVRCWGFNGSGQLGDGTTTHRATPVLLQGLSGVSSMAIGRLRTCAVLNDGTARCWGQNAFGVLGDGTNINRRYPVEVQGLTNVAHIALGDSRTCALLEDGSIRCWGRNRKGALGDGTTADRLVPTRVEGISSAVSLALGNDFACARLQDGGVRCWGDNSSGQLGDGTRTSRSVPVAVDGLLDAVDVRAGRFSACALLRSGSVRCWGRDVGPLSTARVTPELIEVVQDVVAIRNEQESYCALDRGGKARCWGENVGGQLGNEPTDFQRTPTLVPGLVDAAEMYVGLFHSCAILRNATVRCWGSNNSGEIGDGTLSDRPLPVPVLGLADVSTLSLSSNNTCALTNQGRAYCWGANSQGSLGIGNWEDSAVPVEVGAQTPTGSPTESPSVAQGSPKRVSQRFASGQLSLELPNDVWRLDTGYDASPAIANARSSLARKRPNPYVQFADGGGLYFRVLYVPRGNSVPGGGNLLWELQRVDRGLSFKVTNAWGDVCPCERLSVIFAREVAPSTKGFAIAFQCGFDPETASAANRSGPIARMCQALIESVLISGLGS